jgi:[acyl-carrier-protein] S-malonyltransferase
MVLIFPGQGSQQPGMGRFLYENFKIAQETFEEASDALSFDLKKLCFNGSESDLALTENTQPALLVTSTATQRALRSLSPFQIKAVAGHSIGEYAGLVAVNSLTLTDAVRAVRLRGQFMQSAVPVGEGGMVAVLGLEPEQVEKLCAWAVKESKLGILSPANFNSPGQIVISGSAKVIDWLKANFTSDKVFGADAPKKVRLIPLQVSAPFHCELMKPAEEKMRQVLKDTKFQQADAPVLQNFTANFHIESATLRENLIRQISAPVKWMQSMNRLLEGSLSTCIECGAGSVLKGLLKKIEPEKFQVFTTNSLEEIENIEKFIKDTTH